MSSKWVPVRDTILDALKIDVVTEEMKAGLTRWLLAEVLPAGKKAAVMISARRPRSRPRARVAGARCVI